MNTEEVKNLPIYSITPDPEQARKVFPEEALRELADSISLNGVILPIIVTPIGNEQYQIIAGERRWRASLLAGKTSIPAIIRELEPFTRQIQSLLENIQRSDLNPLEEAEAYEKIIDEFDLSHEELAERVGKSRAYITNALRLLKLPSFVKDCLRDQSITNGHAKVLLALNSEEDMIYLCGKIVSEQWSVKQAQEAVDHLKKERGREAAGGEDGGQADTGEQLQCEKLELELTRKLGTRVSLDVLKNKNGSIKIHFHDFTELERILELIGYQDK